MEAIHKQVHTNLEETNRKYKMQVDKHLKARPPIKEGDHVWVYLRKNRFPQLRKNKLLPRAIGPYPVLKKYGDNAFEIQLPVEYNVSPIFNIGDLTLHKPDQQLGTILFQGGGVDADASGNKAFSNHMQGQNNTSDSLSTPISQQEQETSNDTFHTSGIDPRTLKETKETQHTIETSIVGAKEPTDNRGI
ncbi:uncharacterized protein LOC130797451 isoform X3 [Amaranthus tricolor]|uniref:uncharacterized protein LOC130797451 isoform X3 n=1 Tax=Amaranthus tricolor TaxID=29722 RepID=UPI002590D7D6|nr:uncharacterized protein LOC130797451 isoform X3 [Amaranthus tricolor]XP_057516015.1 uncharacterized protein LOC130797451 isoform X3 [Amaranthus tricolor]